MNYSFCGDKYLTSRLVVAISVKSPVHFQMMGIVIEVFSELNVSVFAITKKLWSSSMVAILNFSKTLKCKFVGNVIVKFV